MIPMDAASLISKPRMDARTIVKKIPNCAAAPNKNIFGLESRGPKSIMAPIPINRRSGNASDASIPVSNSHCTIPWVSPTPSMN